MTIRPWPGSLLVLAAAAAALAAPALAAPARKPAPVPAATSLPPALVDSFRKIRALTADFHEEKRMAILVAPIVRSGKLYYEAPGRLGQHVARPAPSRLLLDGDLLTIVDGKQRTVIDIGKQPAVGLLVRLLLGVLAGDVKSLESSARVNFAWAPGGRAPRGWTLELVPKDPLLQKLIKHMRVVGRGTVIDVLTLVDASGDETVTRFSNVSIAAGFTAKERAAYFGEAP